MAEAVPSYTSSLNTHTSHRSSDRSTDWGLLPCKPLSFRPLQVFEASPSYTSQPGAGVVINFNGARALEAINPAMLHRWVQAGRTIQAYILSIRCHMRYCGYTVY